MIKTAKKVGNDIYGVKSNWKLEARMGETAETGFRHNSRYHNYFHGYTEVRVEKPRGGYTIQRVYTEDWYVEEGSRRNWLLRKVVSFCLVVAMNVLFLFLMTRPHFSGNQSFLVSIPGFFSLPCLVLLDASTVGYLCSKRNMTWWEFVSGKKRMRLFAFLVALSQMATAAMVVINGYLTSANRKEEGILALGIGLCSLLTWWVYGMQKRISYTRQKNETNLPEGEVHLIL